MVEKVITAPHNVVDFARYQADRGAAGRAMAMSACFCRHCGAALSEGEREDECSSVANVGMDPDIWGSALGMLFMFGALVVIPFIDRGKSEPRNWKEAFDIRKRGFAFTAMFIFWVILLLGTITSLITEAG